MHPHRLARPFLLPGCIVLALCCSAVVAHTEPTVAVRWNDVLLECVRRSRIGPPMVARAIGVTHTCGFDAWALYDHRAVGTRLDGAQRRPRRERTVANRVKAFSYAEYRALLDLFPAQAAFIREQMVALGYDPDDASLDPSTPAGAGNVCARAVLQFRHVDGSNQLGDLHAGPYSDYTGYQPVNTPDQIIDPNRWQPLRFCDGSGGFVTPGFIAPQWGQVKPFALRSWDQFEIGRPKRYPGRGYARQAEEVVQLNARLTEKQKMIAEYWADGPRSELPPGHWMLFGEFVSERDRHSFDQDVKMFFALGNAVMDAGIAAWGYKREFDSVRPITAIRFLYSGKQVLNHVPFQGPRLVDGRDWMPYQPCSFVTPPFAEYPSGHSAFSAAGAEILERFTGSDRFGALVTFPAGSGRLEPGFAPAHDVTLRWATFSAAADEAGMSRRWGGIHFEDGDLDSRRLGRLVARAVWKKARAHFEGRLRGDGHDCEEDFEDLELEAPVADLESETAPIGTAVIENVSPNPGRDRLRVEFALGRELPVTITLLDLQGRQVAVLANGTFGPGRHEASWVGRVAEGIYFVHLETPAARATRKIAIVTR